MNRRAPTSPPKPTNAVHAHTPTKPTNSVRGSTPESAMRLNASTRSPRTRSAGYTLVEMLIALVIAAVLGVAIAAATSASFHAYGTSMEDATMQNSGRMVMQRVMSLIRTGTEHDAHDPDQPALTLLPPSSSSHPLRSVGVRFQGPDGSVNRIWWQPNEDYESSDTGDVMIEVDTGDPQILIARVTAQQTAGGDPYIFTLASRNSQQGLQLIRATFDLQIQPDPANTTPIEDAAGATAPLRLVASTVPRKNID